MTLSAIVGELERLVGELERHNKAAHWKDDVIPALAAKLDELHALYADTATSCGEGEVMDREKRG
jgi:hypothetical protein